jgi:hypothetical protein
MTMAFDTLKFSHRLQQVGVSREQADAHAELARDMVIAELATKSDLAVTSKDLQSEIKAVRNDLQAEIRLLEQRMTVRLGAMLAAAVGIVVAAQKLI